MGEIVEHSFKKQFDLKLKPGSGYFDIATRRYLYIFRDMKKTFVAILHLGLLSTSRCGWLIGREGSTSFLALFQLYRTVHACIFL